MKKQFKAAAIQAAPVFLNLDATVDKACGLIKEAADNGAELVVFPEAFFPGYPYWIWLGDPGYGMPFFKRYYENAVTIPGDAVMRLSNAARENNVFLCASVTEKDRGSLYLTQLWFDKSGNLIGKHRKVRPTGVERTIWGEGDGSMMQVYDTELGRLGGLQCWEHMMPMNSVIMCAQDEQVHAAAWPAFAWDPSSPHYIDTRRAATKYYAIATGTYAVLATETLSQEAIDEMCGDDEYKRGIYKKGYACGARIINPFGKVISKEDIPHDEEGIAYGDIDLSILGEAKYHMDCAGHYSKPSVARVVFNRMPAEAVQFVGSESDYSVSYEELMQG